MGIHDRWMPPPLRERWKQPLLSAQAELRPRCPHSGRFPPIPATVAGTIGVVRVGVVLRELGGIASSASLIGAGASADRIERAARSGEIVRVRRGWYCLRDCRSELVQAVACGGALSCVSALRLQGTWTIDAALVHVRVPRGTRIHRRPGVRIHWSDERLSGFPLDAPAAAVAQLIRCLDTRATIVALDSAVNRRLITASEMERICSVSPRGQRLSRLVDPRSESGLETIARLALRQRNIRVSSQVTIPGVGRVDLLIGDRLILELDGEGFHDFETDRQRDRAAIVSGYEVLRASYRQVMDDWPQIEQQILELVRRREHLWRASHHTAAVISHADPCASTRGG